MENAKCDGKLTFLVKCLEMTSVVNTAHQAKLVTRLKHGKEELMDVSKTHLELQKTQKRSSSSKGTLNIRVIERTSHILNIHLTENPWQALTFADAPYRGNNFL